ncbi:hypothetical protein WYO_0155 [Methylobacterium sp. GXF4]|uniref:hypothetical protein n=1 Tax=Methylobacterium sp. GXF4 TaxID=1096546 RepID=UPI0002698C44|nr:hypothetical protein [Methylobacterium sp. GXF4]EIZ87118.1 hypothetical protein WYO_0155 [Methylobacterium sp. GXF4]
MRPDEVQWRKSAPQGQHAELWTARFDTLSEDGSHRLGRTVSAAYWPAKGTYAFTAPDVGRVVDAGELAFKCWLQDKCQVFFNEWGEF